MDEPFRLTNDTRRAWRPATFDNLDRRRQGVLLSGLDCLPGQQDLFAVDGSSRAEQHTEGTSDDSARAV